MKKDYTLIKISSEYFLEMKVPGLQNKKICIWCMEKIIQPNNFLHLPALQ